MTGAQARKLVNDEIKRANAEDARNDLGGCDGGSSVEDSVLAALLAMGFARINPVQTDSIDA